MLATTRWRRQSWPKPAGAAQSPFRPIWPAAAPTFGLAMAWPSSAGLYVIGTNRHESRRIDNQLRGRGGRQGDPGCSRFFVSLEDPLVVKYGDLNPAFRHDPAAIQSLVEGQHLDQRLYLQSYDSPVEGQRNKIHAYRQQ